MIKKYGLLFLIGLNSLAYGEDYLPNYGYYENNNEISAKNRVIPTTSKIFDFDNSPNPGGESIQQGRYYVPVQYQGGYNGTDTDYIYVDELAGTDGKDGKDGLNADAKVVEEKINQETNNRINADSEINNKLNFTSSRVDNLDRRVSTLEETKWLVDVEARLLDRKHTAISLYNSYDYRHGRNNAIGLKFLFKIGKSYEEKKLEELERKLNQLMQGGRYERLSFRVQEDLSSHR